MTLKTADKLLSFEEYLNYDDGTDSHYELVLGRLEIMNPPTVRHFLIAKFLDRVFDAAIERQNYDWLCFREAGIRTGWQKSRLPDLFVVDKSMALELLDSSAVFQTTPYLIVEIVSPESKNRDYRYKRCSEVLGVSPQSRRLKYATRSVASLLRRRWGDSPVLATLRRFASCSDCFKKRSEYAALEVPEYWIVDPQQDKVTVLVLNEGLYEENIYTQALAIASPTFVDLRLTPEEILSVK